MRARISEETEKNLVSKMSDEEVELLAVLSPKDVLLAMALSRLEELKEKRE